MKLANVEPMRTTAYAHGVEAVIRPLDVARREFLRVARRVPLLGTALRSVESRVPLIAATGVAVALILTCAVPGVLFVAGPAVLGVPHLASDVRYLVLRQRRTSYWTATIATGIAALLALRTAEMIAPRGFPFSLAEVTTGWAWIAVAAWMGAFAGPVSATSKTCSTQSGASHRTVVPWRRAMVVSLFIAATSGLAVAYPQSARALLAYVHNLAAPIIWLLLFRGRKATAVVPLVLVAAGACLLLSAITVPWLRLDDPWVAAIAREARYAAPSLAPATALAVGLSYVFLQAVHYSIWLVWIPQETVRGDATLTFAMSLRAARRDFGARGLAIIGGGWLTMTVASLVAVHGTRHFYLSIATFHAYLELACLAYLGMQQLGVATTSEVGRIDRNTA